MQCKRQSGSPDPHRTTGQPCTVHPNREASACRQRPVQMAPLLHAPFGLFQPRLPLRREVQFIVMVVSLGSRTSEDFAFQLNQFRMLFLRQEYGPEIVMNTHVIVYNNDSPHACLIEIRRHLFLLLGPDRHRRTGGYPNMQAGCVRHPWRDTARGLPRQSVPEGSSLLMASSTRTRHLW